MHALRCRLPRRLGARLDAELVAFDVPVDRGLHRREESQAELDDAIERLAEDDAGSDRLEPSLDAADERVVVEALVVGLVRLEAPAPLPRPPGQPCVPPAPIAMALRKPPVARKNVPAPG